MAAGSPTETAAAGAGARTTSTPELEEAFPPRESRVSWIGGKMTKIQGVLTSWEVSYLHPKLRTSARARIP